MLVVFSGNCGRSMYHFRLPAIKRVQQLGYSVAVVLPKDDFTEKIMAENLKVVTLSKMQLSGTNGIKDFSLYKEYLQVYKNLKPGLIFHYTIKPNIYGTSAATKLNIPCVAIITGLGYTFINKGLIPSLAKKMYQYALKKASQVWFLNKDDKSLFEEKHLVSAAKTFLLNGEGIDTNHYSYASIDHSKRSFILIGRLLFDKGVREYYEAAKKLKEKYPQVSFNILGFLNVENPMAVSESQLKEWTSSGVIEYLGSSNDVRPFIKNSTCVVLPSYREGMSVTLMEAASIGRPLIATNISGCRELINDGETGYLCKVKDADSLEEKMETIINLEDDAINKMGIKSRQKMINEFSMEFILPKYEKAVEYFAK
jgi:glycosyltransferase involved in cell wall biosynthesis